MVGMFGIPNVVVIGTLDIDHGPAPCSLTARVRNTYVVMGVKFSAVIDPPLSGDCWSGRRRPPLETEGYISRHRYPWTVSPVIRR